MRKVEKLGVLHVRYLPEALREQIERINLHRKTAWVSAAAVPVSMVGTAGYYLLDKPAFAIPMAVYGAVAAALGIWSAKRKAALTRELAPQLAKDKQAQPLMKQLPTHIRVRSKVIEFLRAPHLKGKVFQTPQAKPNPPAAPKPKQREVPRPQALRLPQATRQIKPQLPAARPQSSHKQPTRAPPKRR